jgi:hypothetical protein
VHADDPVFNPSKNLSNNPGNANSPMMAVSGNHVYVVWRENNDIYFKASANNGGTFGSSINLSTNAGTSQAPRIAASGSFVYVLWQDNTPGNYEMFFKRSINNGTSFGSLVNLSNDASYRSGGLLSHLDLAASDSNVYVVWQKDDQSATEADILLRRSNDNGATFASATDLSGNSGTSQSQSPQVAADGSNAHVVWRDNTPGNFDIFLRSSTNNGTSFSSTINLSSNAGSSQTPQVAADGSNAYVVWRDSTPGNFDIFLRASNNTGTSFAPTLNLSNNTGSSQSPQIDAAGDSAYVAWRDDTPGNLDILFRASTNTGTSFAPTLNLSNNTGSSNSPDVEAYGDDVYVAWYDSTLGNFDSYFRASEDNGNSFGSTLNLSNNAGSSQSPDVEASSTEIYVAWYDNTSGNNEILFRATDDAPTANGQSVSTNEDTPKIITLTGSDPESDALTFLIVTNATQGTLGPISIINATASQVTYTPNLDYFGSDSFTFKASDGTLNSTSATVDITVNPLNDPPTADSQNVTIAEDSAPYPITITASDPEGDPFDFSIVTNPLNGTLILTPLNATAATATYTPDIDFFGINTFQFRVNDTSISFSNNATVTINVTGVNDPPVANDDSATILEDGVAILDVTASVLTPVLANDTDVDGDTLTIVAVTTPANGNATITGNGTSIMYTPDQDFSGLDSFDYEITDGYLNDTATVSVNVTQVNDAPISYNLNATTAEDTPVDIELTGSDVEGGVDFVIIDEPDNGEVNLVSLDFNSTEFFTYTPDGNFNGNDTFKFYVTDGITNSSNSTVLIMVTPVNDPPIADDDLVTIEGNTASVIDVLANDEDIDGDTLTIISTSSPSNGNITITGNGTSVTYTPDLNFIGVDSFDYTIKDPSNEMSAASVDIIVTEPEEFKVKKGTFVKSIAAAPAVQNITGLGFQPKALILFTSDQTAEGFNDSYSFAMGFSNGTTSRSVATKSDDNAGVSNAARAFGKHILRLLGSGDPTIVAQANVIGFNSDGFALNWTSNTSTPSVIHYLALGGVDITDVAVSNFIASTTAVNQTITGPGFQPDFVMFMHAGKGKVAGKATHGYISYGFAKSATERGAIAVNTEDNRNLMDARKWQRTDRAIIALDPQSGAIDAQADFVSMNPDGFTVEWIDPPADADRVYYLAIKGGSYNVGSLTSPSVVGSQSVSGLGLQPRGLILTSYGNPGTASPTNDNRIAFGAAHTSGDGSEGSIWAGDRGLVDTSITGRSSLTTKVIRLAVENTVGTTSVIAAAADLESFDADGFTLNWTTINGSGSRQIIYVAFG